MADDTSDSTRQDSAPKTRRKALVKIDNFVRKHTSEVDVETLHRRGVTRINYLTYSKVNDLVAIAVAKAFEKYGQAEWNREDALRVERDAKAELGRRFEALRTGASAEATSATGLDAVGQRIRDLIATTLTERARTEGEGGSGSISVSLLEAFERSLLEVVDSVIDTRKGLGGHGSGESAGQTELLERRIEKLKTHIAEMESSLKELEARSDESGIPSIYREVQGLSSNDEHYKQKKSLLKVIFEDNLKLQCQRTSTT